MARRPSPPPPPPPDEFQVAIRAWSLLGGLDWDGLELVGDMLGVQDYEALIYDLTIIRDNT